MRSSRPIPRATSTTSAPVSSQTLAISLMNEIFVARNAFDGELDHLRAGDVGAHQRAASDAGSYSSTTSVARPVALVAHDDAVGVQEVLDRRALLQELGAGDVAQAVLAPLAEHRAGSPRPCRTARSTSSPARARPRPGSRRRPRAPPTGRRRRSRSAACRPRRTAAARARAPRPDRWRSAAARALRAQQLLQARLVDRHLAARSRSIFSASMSTHHTSLPSSAKPAAVTSPT